jgi:hypothetical protein
MMEAVRTSETSVDSYFTRQYIPEDNSELHSQSTLCSLTRAVEMVPFNNVRNRYDAVGMSGCYNAWFLVGSHRNLKEQILNVFMTVLWRVITDAIVKC